MARTNSTDFNSQYTGCVPRWAAAWSASWVALLATQGHATHESELQRRQPAVNLAARRSAGDRPQAAPTRGRRIAFGLALCAAMVALAALGLTGCGSKATASAVEPAIEPAAGPATFAPRAAPEKASSRGTGTRDHEAADWIQGTQG
jgi:hypothetical protein